MDVSRFSRLMATIAGAGILWTGIASTHAQAPAGNFYQPVSYDQVLTTQGCDSCDSISASQYDTGSYSSGCQLGCGDNGLGEPWTLFGRNECRESKLNIGGWVQGGYHSQDNGLFNNHSDRFNLHQGWLFVEKKAVAGACGEAGFGFRFDGMYGVDAANTQAFGNPVDGVGTPRGWDNGPNFTRGGGYGWALPQAYLEMAKDNWALKVGHFFTPIGYEVVGAPGNFFYSHAITMNNSEPFTHTGALASYSASENVTYFAGWTAGWDTGFDQFNDGSNFLGGATRALGEYVTLTTMSAYGDFGARGSDGSMSSMVLDMTLTDRMQYVIQSDILRIDSTGEDNFGINQYLFYDLNERTRLGTRVEWWKGDTLTNYAPHGGVVPATGSLSYYEITSGINYKVNSNVTLRPEYRYDWSPGAGYEESIFGIDFVATF